GRNYIRRPGGAPADDQPLPEWANALDDFVVERRGPDAPDLLIQGPKRDQPFLSIWPLEREKKEPVRVPDGGGLSFRVGRDRAGRDVFVAFRRHPSATAGEELEFWDLGTGKKLSGFEPRAGGGDPAVSWDGRTLLTVSTLRPFYVFGPNGQD